MCQLRLIYLIRFRIFYSYGHKTGTGNKFIFKKITPCKILKSVKVLGISKRFMFMHNNETGSYEKQRKTGKKSLLLAKEIIKILNGRERIYHNPTESARTMAKQLAWVNNSK